MHGPETTTGGLGGEERSGRWTPRPCVGCSTDLVGRDPDDRCPRCGLPVSLATGAHLLTAAPTNLRRRVRLGIAVLLGAIGVGILLGVVKTGVATVASLQNEVPDATLLLGINLATLALVALATFGWWSFAASDASLPADHPALRSGRLVRILAIVHLVVRGGQVVVEQTLALRAQRGLVEWAKSFEGWMHSTPAGGAAVPPPTGGQPAPAPAAPPAPPSFDWAILIDFAWTTAFWLVLLLPATALLLSATMLHARHLAARVPDRSATNFAKLGLWLLPLTYVVGTCLGLGVIGSVIVGGFAIVPIWRGLAPTRAAA